jgi:hypothetical protein
MKYLSGASKPDATVNARGDRPRKEASPLAASHASSSIWMMSSSKGRPAARPDRPQTLASRRRARFEPASWRSLLLRQRPRCGYGHRTRQACRIRRALNWVAAEERPRKRKTI